MSLATAATNGLNFVASLPFRQLPIVQGIVPALLGTGKIGSSATFLLNGAAITAATIGALDAAGLVYKVVREADAKITSDDQRTARSQGRLNEALNGTGLLMKGYLYTSSFAGRIIIPILPTKVLGTVVENQLVPFRVNTPNIEDVVDVHYKLSNENQDPLSLPQAGLVKGQMRNNEFKYNTKGVNYNIAVNDPVLVSATKTALFWSTFKYIAFCYAVTHLTGLLGGTKV